MLPLSPEELAEIRDLLDTSILLPPRTNHANDTTASNPHIATFLANSAAVFFDSASIRESQ
jgi:hypothetical protein